MNVLVFDIDGTLTETNRVDGEYFKAAIRAAFPDYALDSFRGFTEFTDTAILGDICQELGAPDYGAIERVVHDHFLAGLDAAVRSEPEAFSAVVGATEIFAEARLHGWIPAVATGGWRASAELKLSTARIPMTGVPLATSSERARRVEIIELAVAEASQGASVSDVVYVGDGTWDVRACRELGIGFLGRGPADATQRLTDAGARAVVEDFGDSARVLELVSNPDALRPRSS